MPKKRRLGHRVKVKVGTVTVGFLKNVKIGGMSREPVSVTTLEDTVEEFLDADPPMMKPITFTMFWDPEDTAGDVAIENIFLNDEMDEREVDLEFQYPVSSSGTSPSASTFSYKYRRWPVRIIDFDQAEVSSKSEMLVTVTAQPVGLPSTGTVT